MKGFIAKHVTPAAAPMITVQLCSRQFIITAIDSAPAGYSSSSRETKSRSISNFSTTGRFPPNTKNAKQVKQHLAFLWLQKGTIPHKRLLWYDNVRHNTCPNFVRGELSWLMQSFQLSLLTVWPNAENNESKAIPDKMFLRTRCHWCSGHTDYIVVCRVCKPCTTEWHAHQLLDSLLQDNHIQALNSDIEDKLQYPGPDHHRRADTSSSGNRSAVCENALVVDCQEHSLVVDCHEHSHVVDCQEHSPVVSCQCPTRALFVQNAFV